MVGQAGILGRRKYIWGTFQKKLYGWFLRKYTGNSAFPAVILFTDETVFSDTRINVYG
jgi:hypothetical protein